MEACWCAQISSELQSADALFIWAKTGGGGWVYVTIISTMMMMMVILAKDDDDATVPRAMSKTHVTVEFDANHPPQKLTSATTPASFCSATTTGRPARMAPDLFLAMSSIVGPITSACSIEILVIAVAAIALGGTTMVASFKAPSPASAVIAPTKHPLFFFYPPPHDHQTRHD